MTVLPQSNLEVDTLEIIAATAVRDNPIFKRPDVAVWFEMVRRILRAHSLWRQGCSDLFNAACEEIPPIPDVEPKEAQIIDKVLSDMKRHVEYI
jgi:hypothetical protein